MDHFVIHCVFDGEKGMGDFSDMCSFCLQEGIPCVIRPFSHGREEDKDEIIRLPAYHLFYKDEYELTFYPGDCPAATLEEVREKSANIPWPQRILNFVGAFYKTKKIHSS